MDTLLHRLDIFLRFLESSASSSEDTGEIRSSGSTAIPDQAGMESPFVNLPPHVALQVVTFLENEDLKSSALVSHAWLRASNATVRDLKPRVFEPLALHRRFGNLEELDLSRARGINDQTLGQLGGLSNLRGLCVKRCREISNKGLERVFDLTRLTRLSLARCPKITSEGLRNLIIYLTELCSLNIKYCYKITDDGMQGLDNLRSLTFLNCSSCRRITDAGIDYISKVTTLRTLKASRCPGITEVGFFSVAELSNLATLNLRMDTPEQQQTNESIAKISTALPSLTSLDITLGNRVTLQGIQQLWQAKSLKRLKLGRCRIAGNELVGSIAAITGLETLSLSEIHHLSDSGMIGITKLHNLKSLSLRAHDDTDNSLTDNGLETLTMVERLSELHLAAFLSIRGATLYKLTSLSCLGINSCQEVGGASLREISQLTNLKRLTFSGTRRITDQTIGYLSPLTKLESLMLCDCQNVTCNSASYLSNLSKLTVLTLSLCQNVSDSSLKEIASLESLIELNLGCCNHITDAGVIALGQGQLFNLRSVNIACCKNVTEEGTQKLRSRLPKLQSIERKALNHALLHAVANSAARRAIV